MKLLITTLSLLTLTPVFSQSDSSMDYVDSIDFYAFSLDYEMVEIMEALGEPPIVREKTIIDSLEALSREDQIAYFKNGGDPNEVVSGDYYDHTVFRSMAHAYGFWCVDEDQDLVFAMIEAAKTPIKDPFFFMEDPCGDRKNDILDYFIHMNTFNQKLSEDKFEQVRNYYIAGDEEGFNFTGTSGRNALICATILNYPNQVEKLVTETLDVNQRDNSRKSALEYAIENKNTAIMKLLLENGANPSLAISTGSTPLMEACKNNDLEAAFILMDFGADAKHKDKNKMSALKASGSKATKKAIKAKMKSLRKNR